MIVMDYTEKKEYSQDSFPDACKNSNDLFIFCKPSDVIRFFSLFDLDESTVIDCMDIDESVRFTAFNGYDFASLVHAELKDDEVFFKELNLYISRKYMILVIPEHDSKKLTTLEEKILETARGFLNGNSYNAIESFNQLLFIFFNTLIAHFSDMLELLEDKMQALSEDITRQIEDDHFEEIQDLRSMAYTLKKVLRSFSYIGLQILCNENDFIIKKKLFLFRNLDTRFRKLYDFSENVYGLSTELLNTYDSKITQKTNDVINKLAFVTLFFGPLTVITGIYGMNFEHMPELDSPLGYPLTIIAMIVISFGIYLIMKKKKWL